MKMSAQVPILFGLLFLIHGIPALGEDVDPSEKSEPVTPLIERSSHNLPHAVTSSHHHEDPTFQGFWKKKFVWRPRWVKTWQEKKIYVAVWKKMWSPALVKEWVPVPKPPPGWVKHKGGNYFITGF